MRHVRVLSILLLIAASGRIATAQTTTELTIKGGKPAQISMKDSELAQMPRITVSIAAKDGTTVAYEGIALRELLKRAGIPLGDTLRGKALSGYIVASARDGYQVVFSLGELDETFGNLAILVADKQNGKPLVGDQGPLRLICPNDKAPARGVRMLESLEFVQIRK